MIFHIGLMINLVFNLLQTVLDNMMIYYIFLMKLVLSKKLFAINFVNLKLLHIQIIRFFGNL